jgi:hypothetical protein
MKTTLMAAAQCREAEAVPACVAGTDVAKVHFAKKPIGHEARCSRACALAARAMSRQSGAARADVYDVLPRGARVRVPCFGGTSRTRMPGSLTGDCPDARERAVRQRIR